MSIGETLGQFSRDWLIVFLIYFRVLFDSEETYTLIRGWKTYANSFWAAWDRIRVGDNDDRLQRRFGEGFTVAWSGFGRVRVRRGTSSCAAARVSGCLLGSSVVWYLG